ncbi:unnamed protein product, partial [Rotaria magnacalcarata]
MPGGPGPRGDCLPGPSNMGRAGDKGDQGFSGLP